MVYQPHAFEATIKGIFINEQEKVKNAWLASPRRAINGE